MIFDSIKDLLFKRKRKKIRRGWHEYFAWLPTRLEEGGVAWLETIERKYYTTNGRRTIKQGRNERKLRSYHSLGTMYRRKGSNSEKRVYHAPNRIYVDPDEIFGP